MRPEPRHDPRLIYAVHASRAEGLSVAEVAARHGLPLPVVLGFLRAPAASCALLSPFEFRKAPRTAATARHVYWLGFIAACGRLFGQSHRGVLVLAIPPDGGSQVEAMLAELVVGHTVCEFADSSLSGYQAYVRNPALVAVLRQWGLADAAEVGSLPLEYIPADLLPDFVRGYLDGGAGAAWLRGRTPARDADRVTLTGHPRLIEDLQAALKAACGIVGGTLIRGGGEQSLARLRLSKRDSAHLLAWLSGGSNGDRRGRRQPDVARRSRKGRTDGRPAGRT